MESFIIKGFGNTENETPKKRIITTGGTIESEWSAGDDGIVPCEKSNIPYYIEQRVRNAEDIGFNQICMKDSRNLTPEEKMRTVDTAVGCVQRDIVVACGTYAMPDLAHQLKRSPIFEAVANQKRAVFIGALRPMEGFTESDGGFYIGSALAGVEQLEDGEVFVCMNGRLIQSGEVSKDTNATVFTTSHPRFNKWDGFQEFDLVTAGGSIDFMLDGMDGLIPKRETGVAPFLRNAELGLAQKVNHTTVDLRDSRKLLERPQDIDNVVHQIKHSPTEKVLLTMGIYEMEKMRERLQSEPDLSKKTVIITGSRFPLDVAYTDATFNLGYSVSNFPVLSPGVYISLAGKILGDEDSVMDIYTEEEQERIKSQQLSS